MRINGSGKIHDFMHKHTDSKSWLKAWLAEARTQRWQSPADVKARYSSASILNGNRMIFNVNGNKYRMEVEISYKNAIIVIKRLGTHAEYSRWDK